MLAKIPWNEVEDDLICYDVFMLGIRFVPKLKSSSMGLNIRWKECSIPFSSLPAELQKQLRRIAIEEMQAQLERQKERRSDES